MCGQDDCYFGYQWLDAAGLFCAHAPTLESYLDQSCLLPVYLVSQAAVQNLCGVVECRSGAAAYTDIITMGRPVELNGLA